MAVLDIRTCQKFLCTETADLVAAPVADPDTSFVALGGDSLRAVLLATAIEEQYAVVIDIVDILGAVSLRALSVFIVESADAQA